jgi:DNA-binding GntR family transcriptional regulator
MASPSSRSRLQTELAGRILNLVRVGGFGVGHHLVEADLCQHFGVSRTPVRGALALIAERGYIEHRANRGFVLTRALDAADVATFTALPEEEDKRLFVAIAQAHIEGRLPKECAQQELVRMFGTPVTVVARVLRQLADLGVAERKPGNGWSFAASIDSGATQRESYEFRLSVEPQALLQKGFVLAPEWARTMRERHESFRLLGWRSTLAVEFYEMNAEFHHGLSAASGNRYFASAVEQQNRLRRFLNYNWDFGVDRVHASIAEHIEILDALEASDVELGAVLMRRHLMRASNTAPGA